MSTFKTQSENGWNSQRYCVQPLPLHLNCLLWFLLSHVGPHVRLLDPPKHVSDPQVPGHHRRCHLPCWQPHAGTKSCDEVRWAAPLLLFSPHTSSGGYSESSHYLWSFSVALHVSPGTFSSATIISLVVEQWTPGDYSVLTVLLRRGLASSSDPLCSIRLLLFPSSLSPRCFLPLNPNLTLLVYFSLSVSLLLSQDRSRAK